MPYGFVRIFSFFVSSTAATVSGRLFLKAMVDRSEIFAGHGSWSKEEVYRFPTQRDPQGGGGAVACRGAPPNTSKSPPPNFVFVFFFAF